ncbi:hypothetical protein [Virgisporangium aurantiacum]|nr:hypothetical protein [Virgisporangium aurantiacum]
MSSGLRPSTRRVERTVLPAGQTRDLRDAVYLLYGQAGCPRLDDLASMIADDDTLPGAPGKDAIGKIVAGDGPAAERDVVSVAAALARAAGRSDAAAVAERIRQLWTAAWIAPPNPEPAPLGKRIPDCDPIALEVHPAITVARSAGAVGPPGDFGDQLPAYVERAHDARLREAADEVCNGGSMLVTLVGGSSTGKTRACWEIARYIEAQQPGRWRLWHPYDPARSDAAAGAIEHVGPATIVWLNEAQHYLDPPDPRLGERIAAGLRTLLGDPGRGPVLVVATLWPHHWAALTTRPTARQPDPLSQARDLLTAGALVTIPDSFSASEVAALARAGNDERLLQAAAHAKGGRITQFLAGVPLLQERYANAQATARAIIDVATDARRLGHPSAIPHALLEQAAPGYLTDHEWDQAGDDWLEQALAYTAAPCNGIPGPLVRIRPQPGHPSAGPCYRLADYLEQTGHADRAGLVPPGAFWDAVATTVTNLATLRQLAEAASARGRLYRADQLYRTAADRGDTIALGRLAWLREQAGDLAEAERLWRVAADKDAAGALYQVVRLRKNAGDLAEAERLALSAADRGDIVALNQLIGLREKTGDLAEAERLALLAADRASAVGADHRAWLQQTAGDLTQTEQVALLAAARGSARALARLAQSREQTGDPAGAERLALLAADRGDTAALTGLAWVRARENDQAEAERLALLAADRGDAATLTMFAWLRTLAGDLSEAERLYSMAADRGDGSALCWLAERRAEQGCPVEAERLALLAADRGDPLALNNLVRSLERAGDQAKRLALVAADRGNTFALTLLADLRQEAGDLSEAERLYRIAADRGDATALKRLAERREDQGDPVEAERLAADRHDATALKRLAERREDQGDPVEAERLALLAADHGNPDALNDLVWRRGDQGNATEAERLALVAADHGHAGTLGHLTQLLLTAGDPVRAKLLQRYGLTDDGAISPEWD